MAQGINDISYSGNVGSIKYGETNTNNDAVVSFMVCCEKEENFTTWVKVSAYGGMANYCKGRLKKGCYVIVSGELSNYKIKGSTLMGTEIKATRKLVIMQKKDDIGEEFTYD